VINQEKIKINKIKAEIILKEDKVEMIFAPLTFHKIKPNIINIPQPMSSLLSNISQMVLKLK
jgi:hypothetical protein